MNERIRELLDIAQGSIDSMDEQANVIEKFAELIVRECAHYAFSDDQDRRAMLEHFGVAE